MSEFNVQRRDFWFGWDYAAITQTIYLRTDRQPDTSQKDESTGSKYELESLFQ